MRQAMRLGGEGRGGNACDHGKGHSHTHGFVIAYPDGRENRVNYWY